MARAIWFTAPRRAELLDEKIAPPADGEIQVAAKYSLISAGTEMRMYRGEAASEEEIQLPMGGGNFPFPLKYGYQVVGQVEAADEASGFRVGDTVFANHPHQELFTLPARLAFRLPPAGDAKKAAFVNLLGVGLNGLLDVPVRIGDCVVVSGLGIVGTFAAHLARRTAGTLVLVDPITQRRDLAHATNADAIVSPDGLHAAVQELSQGRGADVFIEASGAASALQLAINETGIEGTILVLSYYANKEVRLRLAPEFHLRRQRIVSSQVGRIGSGLQPRWDENRRMTVAWNVLQGIETDSMITHELPFNQAPAAYELIDQHPEGVLGVLLAY